MFTAQKQSFRGVLNNFAKFTGKNLCQSLFLEKIPGLRPVTLLKKRPWKRCFPAKHFRWRLLLITLVFNFYTKEDFR